MNYSAIHEMLNYWILPDPPLKPGPAYDEWRKDNDLDCILAREDPAVTENAILNADMIFSLWVPLRMTLNYINLNYIDSSPRWVYWREFAYGMENPFAKPEYERDMNSGGIEEGRAYARHTNAKEFKLKRHPPFLQDLGTHIEEYLPAGNRATASLEQLFRLGQTRANVMILPDRKMNVLRGKRPYCDYVPHFLLGLLKGDFGVYSEEAVVQWVEREKLQVFFDSEIVEKGRVLDLLGTGDPKRHTTKDIVKALPSYLNTCCEILERRDILLDISA